MNNNALIPCTDLPLCRYARCDSEESIQSSLSRRMPSLEKLLHTIANSLLGESLFLHHELHQSLFIGVTPLQLEPET